MISDSGESEDENSSIDDDNSSCDDCYNNYSVTDEIAVSIQTQC